MRWVLVAALAIAALPRVARAGDATCDYVEVKATADGSIDPSLSALKSKLQQPPFSSYKGHAPLGRGSFDLTKNKPHPLPLKVGGGSVLLRDRDPKLLALTLTIDGSDGKRHVDTKVQLAAGDWVVVTDTSSAKEAHILGLTCK
jgi:hypothetical protein